MQTSYGNPDPRSSRIALEVEKMYVAGYARKEIARALRVSTNFVDRVRRARFLHQPYEMDLEECNLRFLEALAATGRTYGPCPANSPIWQFCRRR